MNKDLKKMLIKLRHQISDILIELNKGARQESEDYYQGYYRGMCDTLKVFEEIFHGIQ